MDHRVLLTRNEVDAITTIAWLLIATGAGTLVHRIARALLVRMSQRSDSHFLGAIVRRTGRPAAYIVPLLAILLVLPEIAIPPQWQHTILHLAGLLTIVAVAWAAIALLRLWADIVIARHRVDVEDNLLARQLSTRVDILTRVLSTLVAVVALAAMLMTFPSIRSLGTTLLASAGVAGLVAGIAARPLFENIVAGVQLALTQPIRIDDVVVINGTFGRIEEIHSTYVVVKVWDLRRLVVPLTYFINTPFENWTRRTSELVGEVHVIADWTLDVEGLRAEIPRILERTPLWDRKVQNCQVVAASDKGIDVRVLVSSANSTDLWDLRCFVLEAIVAHLRDRQPQALPRARVDAPARALDDRLFRHDPSPNVTLSLSKGDR